MTRDRSRDQRKSAGEFVQELQRDPAYAARSRERERAEREALKDYQRSAGPVLRDLAAVGFNVQTIGELTEIGPKYEKAVPILLRWMQQIQDPFVKEDIIRTLSVPWARPIAAPFLIKEFERVDDQTGTGLRWTIANALEVTADGKVVDDLIRLVQNKKYGKAREMLALALAKMEPPRVVPVLTELLDDEQVAGHALIALGRLRAKSARQKVEQFVSHPTTWVRKEAKKALALIDKGYRRKGRA